MICKKIEPDLSHLICSLDIYDSDVSRETIKKLGVKFNQNINNYVLDSDDEDNLNP